MRSDSTGTKSEIDPVANADQADDVFEEKQGEDRSRNWVRFWSRRGAANSQGRARSGFQVAPISYRPISYRTLVSV